MIEALIVIGGALAAAVVGVFVVSRDVRRLSNLIYGCLTLSLIILMVANLFTYGSFIEPAYLLLCIRIVVVSTTVILTLLYFLMQVLAVESGTKHNSRMLNKMILGGSILTMLLGATPFVFSSASSNGDGTVTPVASWGFVVFVIHAFLLLTFTVIYLINGLNNRSKRRRRQDTCIIIGILPTLVFAPITGFLLPVAFGMTQFVALTPLYIVFFVVVTAYAMIRHGLFDIRLAAVRLAAYALTLTAMAALYVGIVYLLSTWVVHNQTVQTNALLSPIAIVTALILALLFQPLKRVFDKFTDRLFYKDNYSMSQFLGHANQTLASTSDLRTLLERTSRVIGETLKTDRVFFFVYLPEGRYLTAGTEHHPRLMPSEFTMHENRFITSSTDVFIASQLDDSDLVRRMMASHRIELFMPLKKAGKLVGYVCLGEPNTIGYTSRDIRALMTLSDELIIAIQNALSVEEVRRLNETLEQRITSATKELRASNAQLQRLDEIKDEFISMASHQLRTPLTSIKGYISMIIDGDAGHITDEQKHLLTEAFVSSERMVRLIGDFLNVSRLQTGKFMIDKHPVDMIKLVQREIDGLKQNAQARHLHFVYIHPKTLPLVDLDENKVQQVIMNFADNAIYYSKDNGKITITLEEVPGGIELKVVDNGIGVPAEEQKQLFNKFFRATNARRARPDGTGVGLFLAKKVVDAHNGTIIFDSKEGKGSAFGFRLPVGK